MVGKGRATEYGLEREEQESIEGARRTANYKRTNGKQEKGNGGRYKEIASTAAHTPQRRIPYHTGYTPE